MQTLALQKKSISGYAWQHAEVDERLALTIGQRYGVPDSIARLLASRDIPLEAVEPFLSPSLRTHLPDPFHLRDMREAAEYLADAVMQGKKIAVFGDYDVDGATSSALLSRFFAMLGVMLRIYIPDRIVEGYGPNTAALLKLKEEGMDAVITVDCGTAALEPLQAAKQAGLDVIVIDHHLGGDTLPPAVAVVNPNRLDETSAHRNMAAVGVCFLLAVAINATLRQRGFYQGKKEPDLLSLLDIVALGTVCDVMTLTGVNRAYVAQGLKLMAKRGNPGLAALADVAGMNDLPTAYHLGFVLGPRINAGGRIGECGLGAQLLSSTDYDEALAIAKRLDHFNAERRALEVMVVEEAMEQVEASGGGDQPIIIAKAAHWHPGVIGIVASRLKEKYNRPTAVIALDNGIGKASARSISGVDLGSAIVSAKAMGHLVAGGGHAMAAGFTVEEAKLPELQAFLYEHLREPVRQHGALRALRIDGYATIAAMTIDFVRLLERLAPFGNGNPEPRFVVPQALVLRVDIVGTDHLRCILSDGTQGGTIKAMAFRCVETPLGRLLLESKGKKLDVAGKIRLNSWQGNETVEFLLDDVAV